MTDSHNFFKKTFIAVLKYRISSKIALAMFRGPTVLPSTDTLKKKVGTTEKYRTGTDFGTDFGT